MSCDACAVASLLPGSALRPRAACLPAPSTSGLRWLWSFAALRGRRRLYAQSWLSAAGPSQPPSSPGWATRLSGLTPRRLRSWRSWAGACARCATGACLPSSFCQRTPSLTRSGAQPGRLRLCGAAGGRGAGPAACAGRAVRRGRAGRAPGRAAAAAQGALGGAGAAGRAARGRTAGLQCLRAEVLSR